MNKPCILIIDDEPGMRKTLSDVLKIKGYHVFVAKDGAEGLALLKENPVNLAVIDLGLPDIPGLALLQQIKAEYCLIEVIILTGNATIDSAIEATNLGAFSYLTKPYVIDQLLLLIKRATEKQYSAVELRASQLQMFQSEKMASIGQLAAGVAHEINNPMGFILSNLSTLSKYTERLIDFMQTQSELLASSAAPNQLADLEEKRKLLKLERIVKDVPQLISESLEGAERVKVIVQNLKTFSRKDEEQWKTADLNECLESTLNVVWNELKYKAEIHREYGDLPGLRCNPGQLNQVFMNLMINAVHAIETSGIIKVKSWFDQGSIYLAISDNGCGMPDEVRGKIFEPFFTTKEVGKGTGLGLSISYDIVRKHNGTIEVESEPGIGTTFTVILPCNDGEKRCL